VNAAACLLAAAAALFAAEAGAHAELVGSTPADGTRLAGAPASVELRFSEPVKPLSVRLFGASREPATLSVSQDAVESLRVALPPDLGEGSYTISFRVVSLDSHPVGGSVTFAVGDAAAVSVAAERDVLRGGRMVLRALRDFALLIAAGGALFLLLVGRFPGERILLFSAALLAVLAAILGTCLQGAAMLGVGDDPWGAQAWRTGIHSSFGLSACVAAGGALLIAAGAVVRSGAKVLLVLGALAAVVSFPLTGHAAGARLGAFGPIALGAHVLAAAFWAGSLCALLAGPSAAALRRFSSFGMAAVALLVAGGVAFAFLQLHSLADVTGSEYGRLIAGKAMLLAGLLVLASLNRFRLLPRLERGRGLAAIRLSIAGEVALVACVIALTAVLVQTPPPRHAVFTRTLEAAGRVAELSVSPARPGENTVTVRFPDGDPAEVLLELSNPRAGIEPVTRPMRRESPGVYRHDGGELMLAGDWALEVRARIGDFDRVIFRAEVPIH
jgi:copper transport protein